MTGLTIDQLPIGHAAEFSRIATPGDVAEFLDSIGDHNPIHHDHQFAAATRFAKPIVPGMWTTGLVSAVLGTQLPGPGAIYVSQDVRFTAPVYFGDTITARAEVVGRETDRNRVTVSTVCRNSQDAVVMTGEAVILPPKTPVVYTERKRGTDATIHWTAQPWLMTAHAASAWSKMSTSVLRAWQPRRERPSRRD